MLDEERSREGGVNVPVLFEELDMAYLYFVNRIQGWARPGSII